MHDDHRREQRSAMALEAAIHIDGEMLPCRLKNISHTGAQFSTTPPTLKGAHVSLLIEPFGSVLGEVVWNSEDASGMKFTDRQEAVEEVLLGLATYAMV